VFVATFIGTPTPLLLWFYGLALRKRSPYARTDCFDMPPLPDNLEERQNFIIGDLNSVTYNFVPPMDMNREYLTLIRDCESFVLSEFGLKLLTGLSANPFASHARTTPVTASPFLPLRGCKDYILCLH
jgi:hypothetical protein